MGTMRYLVVLLLLIFPTLASAQSEFRVSCENVTKIKIVRIETKYWDIQSDDGYFYALNMELTEKAGEELVALYNSTPSERLIHGGKEFGHMNIVINANGVVLESAAPAWDNFSKERVIISIIRKEDAFEAAKVVCPSLVPDKMLIDGQW
ncbi:MAG: hypothetical protein JEY79_19300 [Pseudodesulfovibrio sp.]|nr:hypothetical protein [Pseudodesulfovibrio sp.]